MRVCLMHPTGWPTDKLNSWSKGGKAAGSISETLRLDKALKKL